MTNISKRHRRALLGSSLALALAMPVPAIAQTQTFQFNIPAQPLDGALRALARTSRQQILFDRSLVRGRTAPALVGSFSVDEGLRRLLSESGLAATRGMRGAYVVGPGSGEAEAGGAAADSGSAEEQEIVVTAQKRQERLFDVPQSVSVVSGRSLAQQGALQFRDFANSIPGLTYSSIGAGYTQVTLRGVTSGADITPTVGIYVDEVPYGSSNAFTNGSQLALDVGLFDIDRIEVLRGPQGTLYGASAIGGLLKYVTTEPDTSGFAAILRAGISDTRNGGAGYSASAVFNAPLGEQAALRASGFYFRDGGFIDNLARGDSNVDRARIYGARAELLLEPTSGLTVRLGGFFQNISRSGQATADFTLAGEPVDGAFEQRRLAPEPFEQRFRLVSATIGYDLGPIALTSISSYQSVRTLSDFDYSPLYLAFFPQYSAIAVPLDLSTRKFTQEVRLASQRSRSLEWVVGAFYTRERSRNTTLIRGRDMMDQPSADNLFTRIGPSQFEEFAAFANVTYHFSDRFDVSGGVRYAKNDQNYRETVTGLFGASTAPRNASEGVFTYLANARYRFSDHATAYVRYATGYRPGGPNPVGIDPSTGLPAADLPPSFEADRLRSYEAGFRAETADRTFSADLSAYYIDWNNFHIVVVSPSGFGGRANAGNGASVRGAELTLTARPTRMATLTAALAYQDAKLDGDEPAVGGVKGEQLPGVPRFTAALNADWRLLDNASNLTVGASLRFVSDRTVNFQSSGFGYDLGDYVTLDARMGAQFGPIEAQIYVRNLFDSFGQVAASTGIGPIARVTPVQPRTIGLNLTARY